jgi:hypothetical protein
LYQAVAISLVFAATPDGGSLIELGDAVGAVEVRRPAIIL